MPFTAQEIQNIANAALDFYLKGKPIAQSIQDRPLMTKMRAKQKTFPGGKELIRGNVKGDYTTAFMGFEHDDSVSYSNPANIKQFSAAWFEIHAGIQITGTELKKAGISVVDSMTGEKTTTHTQAEKFAISNLLDDKLDDMKEGSERSFNDMLWRDGTQSAKVFPGVQALILDNPVSGITEGIDRASNAWWRNRARTSSSSGGVITHSTTNQTLTKTLRQEARQLRRYGGRPDCALAGSTAIERLEAEIHEKGTYTDSGFAKNGQTEIGMADITMRGVGQIMYDPTLDDLGREEFIYLLDSRHLHPMVMEGEDWKSHAPARPAEKYVYYRAVTWTGCLIANKLNCHGVYETA